MASTSKAAAIFIILLLAGHEVAEGRRALSRNEAALGGHVQKDTKLTSTPFTDETADVVWQRENNHCRSSFAFWCKEGQASPNNKSVTQCASQPLARDLSPSAKCRVTDAWMLEGTTEKPVAWWVRLQARVLASKAGKFAHDCNSGYLSWASGLCRRRLGHITRASKFISKASAGHAFDRLTPAEQQEVREANLASQERLAGMVFSGEAALQKKALLKRLVNALHSDPQGLAKHPAASAKLLLQGFQQIDADPVAAEEKIAEIERNPGQVDVEGTPEDASVFEISADSEADLDDLLDGSMKVIDNEAALVEQAAVAAGQEGNSLVEMRGALKGDDGKAIVGRVILVLVVIWLVFAGFAIVGGFAFWAAVIAGVCAYKTSGGDEMLPCMGDYLSRPFIWLHESLKDALNA